MIRQEAIARVIASFVLLNLNYLSSVSGTIAYERRCQRDAAASRGELSQARVGSQSNDLD